MSGRKSKDELKYWLQELKKEAIKTNRKWAERLGISVSAAITAVKPSGTVSQLVDSASGIHPRYSDQYIRRVRADARDPLCAVLEASGVPVEDDVMSPSTKVFSQPKGRSSAVFNLHAYEDVTGYQEKLLFMNVSKSIDISNSRRHYQAVKSWCERQLRLEEQLLTSIGAIKDIVRSCNTVGQYKKVSRDLLTFLPEQYKAGLKKYTKESPYPTGLNTEPQVIERMLGTLAYAALQPHHRSEESYKSRINSYYKPSYTLQVFPRTKDYDRNPVRSLEI
jgi:hypothetical protein